MGTLRVTCAVVALLFGSVTTSSVGAEPAPTKDVRSQLNDYLFDAARAGRTDMLQEFVRSKYDLDVRDDHGYTALIFAAYHGNEPAVDLLLQAGANPCAKDNRGNTALMGAIFKGEVAIARKLIAADCAADQKNSAGQTPAMYAALFGRVELLDELAARGADLDTTDVDGNSAKSLARGEIRVKASR
ncbi:MAG: ankyrin repeat domain-containing protein [Steroidobacteraceae bacterium]